MTPSLISVIIPVYNVEKYLKQCLDSVLGQTYQNLEVICINDGSTDNSLSILEDFQRKDPRIILISQENSGPGMARNKGITQAKGKFIYFIDPDDLLPDKNTLSILYKTAIRKKALICGGSVEILTDFPERHLNFKNMLTFFKNEWIDSKDYSHPYGFWRFLYRTDFLLDYNLNFPDYRRYQDPPFFIKVLIKAKKFYAIKRVTYTYRISNKKFNYDIEKANGLAKGLRDCLQLTSCNNFIKMHKTLVGALNYSEYHRALCFLINRGDNKLPKEVLNSINYKLILENYPNFPLPNFKRQIVDYDRISIVIPVYNVEKYLKQCLDSVLGQTYQNLEVICINDGSTDNSLSILEDFQRKDPRIILISQENKGISAARNTGLRHVTSNYVSFVDPDDYIDPRYIEILYNKLYEENADFSLCNFLPFGKDTDKNLNYISWSQKKIKYYPGIPIDPNKIVPMAWGKLFKMNLIHRHKLQFPEGLINEDNYWHFFYCAFSKKYTVVPEKLYFHRKDNPNSIMEKTIFQENHLYDIIKICCQIFDKLSEILYHDKCYTYLDDLFFRQLEYLIRIHQKTSIDKFFWKEIKEYLLRSVNARKRFMDGQFFEIIHF